MSITKCSSCGCLLRYDNAVECPDCGSSERAISVSVNESIRIYDGLGHKVKDPHYAGKKKTRVEGFVKYVRSKIGGRFVRHERNINRASNEYFEKVTDVETGEIIHHRNEPLSAHQGHGSAKSTDD